MGTLLIAALVGISVFGMATVVRAQIKDPRFPDLKREQMTEAQKRVYDEIAGSRGSVRGPFGPLLRSPELADRWQRLGEYVRYKTSLPARLNEFAILITARFGGPDTSGTFIGLWRLRAGCPRPSPTIWRRISVRRT